MEIEIQEKELLDLETSFQELKGLNIAEHIVIPINSELEKFEAKIKKLKFPLWIKLNSSEHKQKINALKKSHNFEELKNNYKELKKKFPDKKFIIQENIQGIEIIAGINEDSTFGRVLLIGAGGTFAEIIKDTSFRVLPVEKEDIINMIKELKINKILEEEKSNIKSLVELIKKFSELPINQADLNPIIINEKEAIIVDARLNIIEE